MKETIKSKHSSWWLRAGYIAIASTSVAAIAIAWASHSANAATASTSSPPLPQVGVSQPLVRALGTGIGFLGQFSAVNEVEIRPHVGGILTGISFKDGALVHKGDRLFSLDPEPYEIRLAQAKAEMVGGKSLPRFPPCNNALLRWNKSRCRIVMSITSRNGA